MKGKRNEDIDQLAEHHNRRMTLTGSGDLFELSSPSINLACRRPSPSNYQPERRSGSAPLPLPLRCPFWRAPPGERRSREVELTELPRSSCEAPARLTGDSERRLLSTFELSNFRTSRRLSESESE